MFSKKQVVFQHWKNGESFERVAKRLGVAKATAEIYVIDLLAEKEDLRRLLSKLEIYQEAFEDVEEQVKKSGEFDMTPLSYNEIRAIIASLINGVEL